MIAEQLHAKPDTLQVGPESFTLEALFRVGRVYGLIGVTYRVLGLIGLGLGFFRGW